MRWLITTAVLLSITATVSAQTSDQPAWAVRLVDGSGAELSVSINNSGILEFRNDKRVVLTIPTSAITGVVHSTHKISRSTSTYDTFARRCCGGTRSFLLPVLAAAIATPLGHSKDHYVEITWYSNGDGAIVLQLSKSDYLRFINWLQQVSGVKWVDVEDQRDEALRQIKRNAGRVFRVMLEDYASGDSEHLLFRNYSALPVELNGQTYLYLFQDQVKPSNLVAILPVAEEWSDNRCVIQPEALLGDCKQDVCGPQAILMPALTYRIKFPKPVTESDAAGETESDCSKLARQRKHHGIGSDHSTIVTDEHRN